MQFQKKKRSPKKKKKREKASGSAASGGSEASEASGPASGEQPNLKQQPVEPVGQEVKQEKRKGEGEDVSLTDTDHDAPSIHSDLGSPIHFEVFINVVLSISMVIFSYQVSDQVFL